MMEILLQPMQPNAPLADIESELEALGVAHEKVSTFMMRLKESLPSTLTHTVQMVMAMTSDQIALIEGAADWTFAESASLRICLGSASHPYDAAIALHRKPWREHTCICPLVSRLANGGRVCRSVMLMLYL